MIKNENYVNIITRKIVSPTRKTRTGERQCASPQDVANPTLFKCSESKLLDSTYATIAIEPLFSLGKNALG